MAAPVLLCLGSINADFQMRVPEEIEEGRTILAESFSRLPGGKAANRALLARRLGRPSRLIGQVGRDDLATHALTPLEAAGLDLSSVFRANHAGTAVSVIVVPPDGKKTIILAPNANDEWAEESMDAVYRLILGAPDRSVLAMDCEVPPALVRRAADAAGERGFRIVLDPSPADRLDIALLPKLHSLSPNPKEGGALVGLEVDTIETAAKAVVALKELGVEAPCLKLADGGCLFVHEGRVHQVEGLAVEPVDTTGAGDAFAGALSVALLEGWPFPEAAAFAVVCSSLAVTRWGSQAAYPSLREIDAQLPPVVRGIRTLQTL